MTLAWRNGKRDSLTIRARIVDPGQGLDAQGTVTVEDGIVTAVEPGAAAPASLVLAPALVPAAVAVAEEVA